MVGKNIFAGGLREIAGVVKDAYTFDSREIEPTFYQPVTAGNVSQMIIPTGDGLRDGWIRGCKFYVTPLSENLDRWLSSSRAGAAIAGLLGGFALIPAAIGIIGVFALWYSKGLGRSGSAWLSERGHCR
jgi:hypothetical protein